MTVGLKVAKLCGPVVVLWFVVFLTSSAGATTEPFDLEIRVVADPAQDAGVVELAQQQRSQVVEKGGQAVAKWVPLHERYLRVDIVNIQQVAPDVVLRRKAESVELLVVLTDYDVVNSIEKRFVTPSPSGRPMWYIDFSPEGQDRMLELTSTYEGRNLALIVNGEVRIWNRIGTGITNVLVPAVSGEVPANWDAWVQAQRRGGPGQGQMALLWFVAIGGFFVGLSALVIVLLARPWRGTICE